MVYYTLRYTPVGLGYRESDPDPDPCISLKKPTGVLRPLSFTSLSSALFSAIAAFHIGFPWSHPTCPIDSQRAPLLKLCIRNNEPFSFAISQSLLFQVLPSSHLPSTPRLSSGCLVLAGMLVNTANNSNCRTSIPLTQQYWSSTRPVRMLTWMEQLHLGILVSSERLVIELYIQVHLARAFDASNGLRFGTNDWFKPRETHVSSDLRG
jgi:hypothetical protein